MPDSAKHLPLDENMLIGALLRVPAQAIHRRLIQELNAAGYDDLRLPHIAVLQYPGPDGVRPGTLAERAGMSKQAMNQLLGSLEDLGYVTRADSPVEAGARVVRCTKRGHAVYAKMTEVLVEIEREWVAELGAKRLAQLKELLIRVWEEPAGGVSGNVRRPSSSARQFGDGLCRARACRATGEPDMSPVGLGRVKTLLGGWGREVLPCRAHGIGMAVTVSDPRAMSALPRSAGPVP